MSLPGTFAGGFDGGDCANRHLVIMGIDDVGVRMRLKQRLGNLTPLVAGEIAGLRGNDLEVRVLGDHVVEALLAVIGRRRTGRALKLDDRGLAIGVLRRANRRHAGLPR